MKINIKQELTKQWFKNLQEIICKNIEENLESDGFQRGVHFEIMLVPNITNITYGRGVGYKFEEEIFEEEISSISATEIRAKLREKGDL